ncbi:MAG: ribosome maturation factor RimM [Tannerella sp.]|jgi:16S rRNA processing protein RimM|nr:ribosome maturation factor RimM [Tannerella sp.]
MIKKEELFEIGYFTKPHGIKGELSLHTKFSDVFEGVDDPYLVCELDGILVPFFLEACRFKGSSVILVKLETVNNEIQARKFSNKSVYCPLIMQKETPDEKQSWRFFTGYKLEDDSTGISGEITDVDESTINTLFKVDYQGKELVVPIAADLIISVDKEDRRLIVTLPEGLTDL